LKFLLVFFITLNYLIALGLPKEYYEIKDTKKMKKYFIEYILKISQKENNLILSDRYFIKNIYSKISTIPKDSKIFLKYKTIQKRYKLTNNSTLKHYLNVIDIIPNSLVIAQAIVESGWGKSRFTKQANNIFGQWTYSGKGLIPSKRDTGKTHKIAIFSSINKSVTGYMINLNLGWGYKRFRLVRSLLRNRHQKLTGIALSSTMINYSQRKEKYVTILKNIIVRNHLLKYD